MVTAHKYVVGMLVVLAGMGAGAPLMAQSTLYRCGNEYTNLPPVNAKARGCRIVEGGNLTVVEGAAPPAAKTAGAPVASTPMAPAAAARADSAEQRARDSDARAILHTELRKAELWVDSLRAEYNDGAPEKLPSEAKHPQRYQERVADMKARLERAQSDVEAIRRELARTGGAR